MRRVKLLQPHRHKGRTYQPGAVIEVRDDQAEWLVGNKIAIHVPNDEKPATRAAGAKKE